MLLKQLAWCGVLLIAGCGTLSKPVVDPATNEPIVDPVTKEPVIVLDQITDLTGTATGLLTGNPLWIPVIGGLGAIIKDSLKKKTPATA